VNDPAPPRAPSGPPRRPPGPDRRGPALVLALLMHGLLIALLFVGLNWQSRQDAPVQAELWTAPPAPPAPPAPLAPPRPPARPEPAPEPAPPPRPQPVPAPAKEDADIRAEQARRDAERREQELREQQKRAQDKRLAEERKRAEDKRAEDKRAEDKRAEDKRAAERKAAEEKRQRDEQARREAERRATEQKAAEDARRRDEQARRDAEAAEARRAEDIRRLQGQAGAGQPVEGAARGGSGGRADATYGSRVAAAIRANTTFQVPADLDGNPRAIFSVQLRPDCTLIAVRLRRPSGAPAWDLAAERAIQRTDPFPKPSDGPCQPELEIRAGPRDER